MKWLTFKVQSTPGFRFNLLDALLIVLLGGLSYWVYNNVPDNTLFLLPLYIGFSFFLFCNVFRVGNRLESLWYMPFMLWSVYCFYYCDNMTMYWFGILIGLEPLKWMLILYHIIKGPYLGIYCRHDIK